MSRFVQTLDLLTSGVEGVETHAEARSVLLRWGGVPIGQVRRPHGGALTVDRMVTPTHAARVLRLLLARWLAHPPADDDFRVDEALCSASHAGMAAPHTDLPISVVICSRDRPDLLRRALTAIVPLVGDQDEMLVVLSAPAADATSLLLAQFPSVRFVVEPRPGLGWARNRAVIESRCEVMLFTDDDCVPDALWIEAHRRLFANNPDVDLAAGLVEPFAQTTPAQRLFEDYGGFPRNYDRRWISAPRRPTVAGAIGNVGEFGAGANLGIRRRLIAQIGAFDAALGPGTESGAGDDVEFLFRALKSGALLAIEPRAVVHHEHRHELDGLESQIEGWSQGFSCAVARSLEAFPEERLAYTLLRTRIAALYHARRALFQPRVRRLATAELRGMRAAAARYRRARETARHLAGGFSPDGLDAPPPPAPRTAVSAPFATANVTLSPDMLRAPVVLDPAIGWAQCSVRILGEVRALKLPVHHGVVGADRLLDAVVSTFESAAQRRDWATLVQETLQQLRRYAARTSGSLR